MPPGDCSATALADALRRLTERPEPIVVDAPAGASRDVAAGLRAADAVVLAAAPTPQSLTDAAKTAAMARRLDAPVVGVVLTRADRAVDPAPLLDAPVLARIPPASAPLADDRVAAAYERAATRIAGGPTDQLADEA